jgi:hypothetical protein
VTEPLPHVVDDEDALTALTVAPAGAGAPFAVMLP